MGWPCKSSQCLAAPGTEWNPALAEGLNLKYSRGLLHLEHEHTSAIIPPQDPVLVVPVPQIFLQPCPRVLGSGLLIVSHPSVTGAFCLHCKILLFLFFYLPSALPKTCLLFMTAYQVLCVLGWWPDLFVTWCPCWYCIICNLQCWWLFLSGHSIGVWGQELIPVGPHWKHNQCDAISSFVFHIWRFLISLSLWMRPVDFISLWLCLYSTKSIALCYKGY